MNSKKDQKLFEQAITILNGSGEVDLATNGMSKVVAKRLLDDIDQYCVETYDDGHRSHLGASLIGHECSRYLWGVFRWLKREPTTGQKQRLFNRGHREEARFVEWLEGIGCQVWFENRDTDPLYLIAEIDTYCLKSELEHLCATSQALAEPILRTDQNYNRHIAIAKAQGVEFPQYRISDVGGHFGGSLDGVCILPERYGIKEPILLEFKTNGTGPKFDALCTKGMPIAKPQHFAQTNTYGHKGINGTKFRYCLYLNICKNDDNIHCEIVKLNHTQGAQMIEKAERIICSQTPPPRLSDNPTFQACGWCAHHDICHKGAAPEVNCRSCKFAVPVEGAQWKCTQHEAIIPKEFIKDACPQYKAITDL